MGDLVDRIFLPGEYLVCLEDICILLFQEQCYLVGCKANEGFFFFLMIGYLFLVCPNKIDFNYIMALFLMSCIL